MAINRVEVSAEQAIQRVAALPWNGQVAGDEIYTSKRPIAGGGTQVSLLALREGARTLAGGDEAVKCIYLERNPYLYRLENAVLLTLDVADVANGDGIAQERYVFRNGQGAEVVAAGKGRQRLVQTVLDNIAQLGPQRPRS